MQIALLSYQLDTGLYHSKVTFSLTPNQRLGSWVHSCKMANVLIQPHFAFLGD